MHNFSVLIIYILIFLPLDISVYKYRRCRKKNKYKKGCDNYLCLIADICPYSKSYIFDDWSEQDET